jgi:streptogramin lyase
VRPTWTFSLAAFMILAVAAPAGGCGSEPAVTPLSPAPMSSAATVVPAAPGVSLRKLPDSGQVTAFQPLRVLVDRGGEVLWMLSWEADGQFLVKFDPRADTVRRYRLTGGPKTSGYYLGFAQAPDGGLWIGWSTVLVRFDPEKGSQQVVKLPPARNVVAAKTGGEDVHGNHVVFAMIADKAGKLWFTRGGVQGLAAYDPATGAYDEYKGPAQLASAETLRLAPHGKLWLGDGEGGPTVNGSNARNAVASFDPSTGSFRLYAFQKAVAGLVVDADGRVWVGGRMVALLDPSDDQLKPAGFTGTVVAADPNGGVWAVDEARRVLFKADAAGKRLGEYQFPEQYVRDGASVPYGVTPDPDSPVLTGPDLSHAGTATVVDASGHVWMTTPSDGLWSVQPK